MFRIEEGILQEIGERLEQLYEVECHNYDMVFECSCSGGCDGCAGCAGSSCCGG